MKTIHFLIRPNGIYRDSRSQNRSVDLAARWEKRGKVAGILTCFDVFFVLNRISIGRTFAVKVRRNRAKIVATHLCRSLSNALFGQSIGQVNAWSVVLASLVLETTFPANLFGFHESRSALRAFWKKNNLCRFIFMMENHSSSSQRPLSENKFALNFKKKNSNPPFPNESLNLQATSNRLPVQ